MNPEEARAALAGVRNADRQLAERIGQCPPWRHAAFGAMFLVLIGSISLSETAQVIGTVIVLAMIVFLVQSDRRRYGVFINGYRRGATLPLTLTYVGTMIVLVAAGMYMRVNGFTIWSKAGLALISFAFAVAMSVKWQRVFLKELGVSR